MGLYEDLLAKRTKLSLTGLGYVGMPIALAFAKQLDVVGYDLNAEKVAMYQDGHDPTKEAGDEAVRETTVNFTADPARLREAKFHIIAVPTPVKKDHTPDLSPVEGASHMVGKYLQPGSIVVYESTVYPGVTEEICVPILEKESGLKCGRDFKVGYSPERINPGDKVHRLETITKVVSGMDADTLDTVAKVYALVAKAGVYRAESIKVAEAAKVIENSQRDINIAFMNELSMIFHRMGIDTKAVLQAAGTKWNFLRFTPGLVGGHCIGVDPYYLTYKAEMLGYHSQIILAGRRINDDMGHYVAEHLVKLLIRQEVPVKNARVLILGITFKENCPDVRNSKIMDIYRELLPYGIQAVLVDPEADPREAERLYGVKLERMDDVTHDLDAAILAVPHEEFRALTPQTIASWYATGHKTKVFMDLKGFFDAEAFSAPAFDYWRL